MRTAKHLLNRYNRAALTVLFATACSTPHQTEGVQQTELTQGTELVQQIDRPLDCSVETLVNESGGHSATEDTADGPMIRVVSLPSDSHLADWGIRATDLVPHVRSMRHGCQWSVVRDSHTRSMVIHPTLAPGQVDVSPTMEGALFVLNGNYRARDLAELIAARLMLRTHVSCAGSPPNMSFVSRSAVPWEEALVQAQDGLASVGCRMTITDRAVVIDHLE